MITLLTGENSFELERALRKIVDDFDGVVERIDGSELELRGVPDLLMGGTLFSSRRLVVIKGLSDNKTIWPTFNDWLSRVSEDVHLLLVESKPDKRTKTYKDLQRAAAVHEFKLWGDRDSGIAEKWAQSEAQELGMTLDASSVRSLVSRVGIDQWALYRSLEKLAVLDVVTPDVIAEVIDLSPTENVFNLFETALRGDAKGVSQMIATLELTEDPYRVFGLLTGQVVQLLALALGDKPSGDIAKDVGAHPYAISKLSSYARKLGGPGSARVVMAFAEADTAMKTSAAEPWLLIERALLNTATL
ncbi:MAG: DNA polymerase III subunit delta [Candidatus Saccharimonadales bacterium]